MGTTTAIIMGYIGVALMVGLSGAANGCIGTSIAGQASVGAMKKNGGAFGSYMILSAIPGSQGLYGFVGYFIIKGFLTESMTMLQGAAIFGAGLLTGLVCLFSSYYQAKICANGIAAIGNGHDVMGKTLILAAFPRVVRHSDGGRHLPDRGRHLILRGSDSVRGGPRVRPFRPRRTLFPPILFFLCIRFAIFVLRFINQNMRFMTMKLFSVTTLLAALSLGASAAAHERCGNRADVPVAAADNTRLPASASKYAVTNRPAEAERLFTSEAVEAEIARVKGVLTNARLAWMFENCFPNTLDTTVRWTREDEQGRDDTVIYTGDIHAMWLRDSGAQVWPYVQLAPKDEKLRRMIAGVIRRQFKYIGLDPYANAFLDPLDPDPDTHWQTDGTQMRPEVYERKWEIDSLCYPIRLAYEYWKRTGDTSVFDEHWLTAMENILRTFREQQRKEGVGPYTFLRVTDRQARHGVQRRQRQSGESRGADRFGVPSVGRCDDLPVPRAVELLRRDVAAQGRRDSLGGEPQAGDGRRVPVAGRRGGGGP